MNVTEGPILIRDHAVPRATVAAASTRLYQWSTTGKFHGASSSRGWAATPGWRRPWSPPTG